MIKRYNGAKAEKTTSSIPLPKGGYVAKIMGAEVMEYSWGSQLVVSFDIAEGEQEGFFEKQYRSNPNEDKKWKGNFRLTIPEESSPYFDSNSRQFNNFMYALEDSNVGYHFDWEEKSLKGKLIGVLFRNKEWELNGQTGWTTECAAVTDVSSIRSGDFHLPKDKPLQSKPRSVAAAPSSVGMVDDICDEDLPF